MRDVTSQAAEKLAVCDPLWATLRLQAQEIAESDSALASLAHSTILGHQRFEQALAYRLAQKLGTQDVTAMTIREMMSETFAAEPDLAVAARADLVAVYERDPACRRYIEPFLFFKGYQALQSYRVAHSLWKSGRRDFALFLQSRVSEQFTVDIHPAARIGRGIMMDHATGVVIGETAVVEDDVSILHGVTLGGTGKEKGDRHPKIRRGVLIAAGAKVLGNIEVGECAKIAAGSVVLRAVPRCATVAGVPARVISIAEGCQPSREMDQAFSDDGR